MFLQNVRSILLCSNKVANKSIQQFKNNILDNYLCHTFAVLDFKVIKILIAEVVSFNVPVNCFINTIVIVLLASIFVQIYSYNN